MDSVAEKILNLCEQLEMAIHHQDGSVSLNPHIANFRLLRNGICFQHLSVEELCAALAGTAATLGFPNGVIDEDHHQLWAWCGQLLFSSRVTLFQGLRHEFIWPIAVAAIQLQNAARASLPQEAEWLVRCSLPAAGTIAFPLLEAMSRRACAEFLDIDGTVLHEFKGRTKIYRTGARCNSLAETLTLLINISTTERRQRIERLLDVISRRTICQNPIEKLYEWRCSLLHSATEMELTGIFALNLALIISLAEIEDRFELARQDALLDMNMRQSRPGHRAPWDFLPL